MRPRKGSFVTLAVAVLLAVSLSCGEVGADHARTLVLVDHGIVKAKVISSFRFPGPQLPDIRVGAWSAGQLAVHDRAGGRIWLQTEPGGLLQPVGRTGSGPGEYRLVIDLHLAGPAIDVLDMGQRQVIRLDRTGSVISRTQFNGSPRSLIVLPDERLLLGGTFLKSDNLAEAYSIWARSDRQQDALYAVIPRSPDEIDRTFGMIKATLCGKDKIAIVRSDTNVMWYARSDSLVLTESIVLPIQVRKRIDGFETLTPDPEALADRFPITAVMGDEDGCVLVARGGFKGHKWTDDLLWYLFTSEGSDTAHLMASQFSLPIGFSKDTVFLLDQDTEPGTLRVLALSPHG